uniref:Gypsy retrotransposon integrase-like protein 1 n=2 Tax=Xiphophorus TaxID=8082 RepID=A0A3B5QVZ8_XIPMA
MHHNVQTDGCTLKLTEKIYVAKTLDTTLFHGWTMGELSQAQDADVDIAPIRSWMKASDKRPPWPVVSPCSPATKTYWTQWKRLYFRDGVLVRRFYCLDDTQFYPQIVLPRKLQLDVMRQMHEGPVGGHFGVERTLTRLRTRYYWYHMREDVALWCKTCTSCASRARPQKTPQAPMGTVQVGAPMERIALDIMGPLNETERGNRYVLVIQDYFTKWTEAFPIPNERAVTVAGIVASEWVCRYGIPQALHSDQGRNFESEVFQGMCSLFGIDKTHTTPFRPQSDGQVERFNATLQKILATTAARCHWDWDLMIPYAVMAYRSTKHSATGFSPNFMMLGREVSEPVDLVAGLPPDSEHQLTAPEYVQQMRERLELAHQIAREALRDSVTRAKRQYDKNCCHTQYKIGDPVWYLIKGTRHVKNKVKKFLPSYEGPFFILGQLDDLVYRIQKNPRSKVKVVHHDQLKHYRSREPLDNVWVLEQSQHWEPTEVPPPTLEEDSADGDLDLQGLFADATSGGAGCSLLPTSTAKDPNLGVFVPSSPSHVNHEDGGGVVGYSPPLGPPVRRSRRRRRAPDRFGTWIVPSRTMDSV